MLVAATSTALATSPQNGGASKLVLNERVDADMSFTLEELADPDLMWLIELVPEEWLDDIDPTAEVRVSLDSKVHVNAMVTERAEGL
ncbi:MAG: hypothetical protein ISF22_07125 [Methanomassiliicoccus sp.]|nr:hypothetical protein [Methanomassiliicoccus sp.]